MRTSVTIALLGLVALLASFADAAVKSKDGASAKHARMLKQAQAATDKILEVKGLQDFEDLTGSPRNFSISMLLTAVESGVQCGPCVTFQPSYVNLAKSHARLKGDAVNRHLFALLEFKNGKEVFQRLALQYAPVLLFYPATSGPYAASSAEPVTFDFNRIGFEGADVAAELSKQLGIKIPYRKPFAWRVAATATLATFFISTVLYLIVPKLAAADSWSIGTAWSILCQAAILITITVMCAGQMWNSIRHAPYMSMTANGQPEYFASGFQNQYGAETQIVALVYAILAFSVVSLTVLVPMQRDPVKQRAGVYIWSAILLAAFSLLLYIFRKKTNSYPFRLFL